MTNYNNMDESHEHMLSKKSQTQKNTHFMTLYKIQKQGSLTYAYRGQDSH